MGVNLQAGEVGHPPRRWWDFVVPPLRVLCDCSWFAGFAVSFVGYYALMKVPRQTEEVGLGGDALSRR